MKFFITMIFMLTVQACGHKDSSVDPASSQTAETKYTRCQSKIDVISGQAFNEDLITSALKALPDGDYGYPPYKDWWGVTQQGCKFTVHGGDVSAETFYLL